MLWAYFLLFSVAGNAHPLTLVRKWAKRHFRPIGFPVKAVGSIEDLETYASSASAAVP